MEGSTMNLLTFPLPVFEGYLRDLVRRGGRGLAIPVGLRRTPGAVEVLAAPPGAETGHRLSLALSDDLRLPTGLPESIEGAFLVGRSALRGRARGLVRVAGRLRPLDRLRLVGPGLVDIALRETRRPEEGPTAADRERWSRTIGALGMEAWEGLVGLRCGVVGVGRTGSVVALGLARLGVRRLTLI